MQPDTIVQFVCFETNVNSDEFIPRWEYFAKHFCSKEVEVTLQEQIHTKNRFKYVSQQQCPEDNFQFAFMKGRLSENFPDCNVKVVQAGGYMPVQIECIHDTDTHDVKIMFFINGAESDVTLYKQLPFYRFLNIYEAYYESCSYQYILEFFVEETQARDVMRQLKLRTSDAEIGMYKECLVLSE
jgi:hypothetical protein